MRITLRPLCTGIEPTPPAPDEVHLWVADLDRPPHCRDRLWEVLTPEEKDRARRNRVARVREQFVAGRGLLRGLLGRYAGVAPGAVPITYEANGKPVLAGPVGGRNWQFNLSHSEGVAVFAVSTGARVGVDVERVRVIPNAEGLVGRFFAPEERAAFAALAAELRQAAFFRAWTCKEAVLKALGAGVQSLDRCVVALNPDEPLGVISLEGDLGAPQSWSLCGWEPKPGFVAAVAVEAGGRGLRVEAGAEERAGAGSECLCGKPTSAEWGVRGAE